MRDANGQKKAKVDEGEWISGKLESGGVCITI